MVGNHLPRWWLDVATAIHFYEAVLATLAILVWHFYQVFFDPDVYPRNWAWWDGKRSLDHYHEEHGLDGNPLIEIPTPTVGQALMTTLLTLACLSRLMPAISSIAFAPLLFRGWFYFVQKPSPLIVRHLGWNELKHATAFCVLFIATYTLAP